MHLTQHTNYALRVLMYLAVVEGPARIADIAEHHRISRNHLVKIVHKLGQSGYVRTRQGRSGGIELARPARDITIGEIVRLTEDNMALVECFGAATSNCKLIPICRLRNKFAEAFSAFIAILDATTIADVTSNKAMILQALGV